jgi:hypothetical protein
MLERLTQMAAVAFSLAIFPYCANAQHGGGAPMGVVAVPHAMAMPVAAPVMHAAPLHVAVGAHAPAHFAASYLGHPAAPHHPSKPVVPKSPARNYPVSSYPGYTNAPLPNDGFNEGGYPIPGLGFDYVHYAAVHPGVYRRNFRGGAVVPFIGGGIYVPSGYYGEPGPTAEQPAEPDAEPAQAQAEQPNYAAPPVSAPQRERTIASTPSAPSPEFIFVRRDGSVFFAIAYSWSNGSLQYITQDGLRRVAPLTTLDLDATSQFNEQRGLSFRSPA